MSLSIIYTLEQSSGSPDCSPQREERGVTAYQKRNRSRNIRSAVVKIASNSLKHHQIVSQSGNSMQRHVHRRLLSLAHELLQMKDSLLDTPVNAPFSGLLCLFQFNCFEAVVRGGKISQQISAHIFNSLVYLEIPCLYRLHFL